MAEEQHVVVSLSGLALAEAFADIARAWLAKGSLSETLSAICFEAVEVIDGCDYASVSLVEHNKVRAELSTGEVPRRAGVLELETGEGPCLDVIRDAVVLRTDDVATDGRWPRFAALVVPETGIHSVLAIRLFTAGAAMGALNLFSRRVASFDEEATAIATVFAAHAAVALASASEHEQFGYALAGRDVIGQAKGILMARGGVSDDVAFDMLRRASQRLNLKLREVAARVAASGGAIGV